MFTWKWKKSAKSMHSICMDYNPDMVTTPVCPLHAYDRTILQEHHFTRMSSGVLGHYSYSKGEAFIFKKITTKVIVN